MGEERGENGRLLVTNIWASPGYWPRPQPRPQLAGSPILPPTLEGETWTSLSTGWASRLLFIPFLLSVPSPPAASPAPTCCPNQLPWACHRPLCACCPHV